MLEGIYNSPESLSAALSFDLDVQDLFVLFLMQVNNLALGVQDGGAHGHDVFRGSFDDDLDKVRVLMLVPNCNYLSLPYWVEGHICLYYTVSLSVHIQIKD